MSHQSIIVVDLGADGTGIYQATGLTDQELEILPWLAGLDLGQPGKQPAPQADLLRKIAYMIEREVWQPMSGHFSLTGSVTFLHWEY